MTILMVPFVFNSAVDSVQLQPPLCPGHKVANFNGEYWRIAHSSMLKVDASNFLCLQF